MGSGVVYYEYEALKEYDDINVESTTELGTIKIRRYHFKDEKFTCLVHSGIFDPDKPYEFPIAMLGRDCSFAVTYKGLRVIEIISTDLPPHDWKAARTWSLPSPSLGSDFIVSSKGWMCEGDETKVEETHGLDGAKSVGSKGQELVNEEEEDPKEDPDELQPMDTSADRIFSSSSWETQSRSTPLLVAVRRSSHMDPTRHPDTRQVVISFKVATYPEHGLFLMFRVSSVPH
ncbi:hypothetical protein PIB30_096692 [Stylosanthes scabra]|uniref:Uncharacterized protein n=1 Tax=Stylosanthes scabra TaxID=79078 RepID=A0ABU6ZUT1_9FABA|nr:hypothetical protein [Stylosanthes scabra]